MHTTQQALSAFDAAVTEIGVRNVLLADRLRGAFVRRLAALGSAPDDLRAAAERLVAGFNHVSGIARQWEPDHSSGADRAKWATATEACADVARLLAAAAPQPPAAQQGEAVAKAALEQIHKLCGADGWEYRQIALRALAQIERATQPAAAPQPVAQGYDITPERAEFIAAWNDLPDKLRCHPGLKRLHRAVTALAAAPAGVAGEPVAWQWRRKGEPWSLDKTFNSQVYATTPDSEVRALYTAPPARQALTDERLSSAGLDYALADSMGSDKDEWSAQDIADAFKAGARSAERYYGIGGKGGADHG